MTTRRHSHPRRDRVRRQCRYRPADYSGDQNTTLTGPLTAARITFTDLRRPAHGRERRHCRTSAFSGPVTSMAETVTPWSAVRDDSSLGVAGGDSLDGGAERPALQRNSGTTMIGGTG